MRCWVFRYKVPETLRFHHTKCDRLPWCEARQRLQIRSITLDVTKLPTIKREAFRREKLGLNHLPIEQDAYKETLGSNEEVKIPDEFAEIGIINARATPGRSTCSSLNLEEMPWADTLQTIKSERLSPTLALRALRDMPWFNVKSRDFASCTMSSEEFKLTQSIASLITCAFVATDDIPICTSDLKIHGDVNTIRSFVHRMPIDLKLKLLLIVDHTLEEETTIPAENDPETDINTWETLKPVDMEKWEAEQLALGNVRGVFYSEIKVPRTTNHIPLQRHLFLSLRQDTIDASVADLALIAKTIHMVKDKNSLYGNETIERLANDLIANRIASEGHINLLPFIHPFATFLQHGKHCSEESFIKAHDRLLQAFRLFGDKNHLNPVDTSGGNESSADDLPVTTDTDIGAYLDTLTLLLSCGIPCSQVGDSELKGLLNRVVQLQCMGLDNPRDGEATRVEVGGPPTAWLHRHAALCRAFVEAGVFDNEYLTQLLDGLHTGMGSGAVDAQLPESAAALVDIYVASQHFAVRHPFCMSCLTHANNLAIWKQLYESVDPKRRLSLANALKIAALDSGCPSSEFEKAVTEMSKDLVGQFPGLGEDSIGRFGL